ncbi:hypothetical protein [Cysteiniphilum litorale]|uniref:hypothetical protein n=1 Tax=Cysteiniphilum litorale TaxID=2056700 RepID=UPI003F8844DC
MKSMSPNSNISQNSDILNTICQHLQINDIVNLLMTNRAIYQQVITHDKYKPIIMKLLVLDYITSAHTNMSQALSDICEELLVTPDTKDNANQMINNFFAEYRLKNTQENQWDLRDAIHHTKQLSFTIMKSKPKFLMMSDFDTRLFDDRAYSHYRDYRTNLNNRALSRQEVYYEYYLCPMQRLTDINQTPPPIQQVAQFKVLYFDINITPEPLTVTKLREALICLINLYHKHCSTLATEKLTKMFSQCNSADYLIDLLNHPKESVLMFPPAEVDEDMIRNAIDTTLNIPNFSNGNYSYLHLFNKK